MPLWRDREGRDAGHSDVGLERDRTTERKEDDAVRPARKGDAVNFCIATAAAAVVLALQGEAELSGRIEARDGIKVFELGVARCN